MKASDLKLEHQKAMLIEQLKKYECYDNEYYTLKELENKLLVAKAMDVKVKSPHSDWW